MVKFPRFRRSPTPGPSGSAEVGRTEEVATEAPNPKATPRQLPTFNADESITIFSEARGGSTWLMELISDCFPVMINWEPLHGARGVVPEEFDWGWRPNVTPEQLTDEHRTFLHDVHAYRLHNDWTRSRLKPAHAERAERALVKYVRANAMVPAILEAIDFRVPPAYLLRHPID